MHMHLGIKSPLLPVIIAAALFGMATPLLKLLLAAIEPLALTAFLYTGAGVGVACLSSPFSLALYKWPEFGARDYWYLAGTVIIGGIFAPIIQFAALAVTPAATASLLLNFEIVTTCCIAYGVFRESVNKRLFLAVLSIFLGSIILSLDTSELSYFSLGAMGIIVSCIFWGLDNNLMGKIRCIDPRSLIIVKGLAGGFFSFLLVVLLHVDIPGVIFILLALLTGFLTFGLGLVFLVSSLQSIGAIKTGAYFAIAPFIGSISSLFLFHEIPGVQFLLSLLLFIAGFFFLLHANSSPTAISDTTIFRPIDPNCINP